MAALPALVRAVRYGDVRGTATAELSAVVDALVIRICAGLPAAVSGLADEAAAGLRGQLDSAHAAIGLHAQDQAGEPARERWLAALTRLADRRDVHGLLAGRILRLLADGGAITAAESVRRFAAHLTVGVPPAGQAAWAEGFLSGSGLLLVHDRALLTVFDTWVAALPEPDFLDALPPLRRVFGDFAPAERASVGRAVGRLGAGLPAGPGGEPVDERRAGAVLQTVAAILGGPA
jgi:hypothetical protein